jgi:hypothetical protein
MSEFDELKHAISVLEARLDGLAAFFGQRVKDLADDVRHLTGIVDGTYPRPVGGLDLDAEARASGIRLPIKEGR